MIAVLFIPNYSSMVSPPTKRLSLAARQCPAANVITQNSSQNLVELYVTVQEALATSGHDLEASIGSHDSQVLPVLLCNFDLEVGIIQVSKDQELESAEESSCFLLDETGGDMTNINTMSFRIL